MERRLFGAESNGTLGCKNFYARAVMSRATMVNLMELTTRAAFLAPTKPVKRSIESKAMGKKKKGRKKQGKRKKKRKEEGEGKEKGEEKKMDRCFSPRGTIMAKDELIWLHAKRTALLPHVFDVIESLVFAKAIVPPFSPPAEKFRAALLPREINLLFRGSDSTRTEPVGI